MLAVFITLSVLSPISLYLLIRAAVRDAAKPSSDFFMPKKPETWNPEHDETADTSTVHIF